MYMPEVSRPVEQVPVYLIPKLRTYPGFDHHLRLSTRHPWFTCVRLCDSYLTGSYICLFPTRSPRHLLNAAAVGGLQPPPVRRLRGARPHPLYSSEYVG